MLKKRNHVIVVDRLMLKEYVDICKKAEYPATDIEGSTLSPFSTRTEPKVGCVGIAWTNNDACCFPVDSRVGLKCKLSVEEVLEAIKEIWEHEGLRWLTHNGKYDFSYTAVLHDIWLGGRDHPTGGIYFDGMLGSYVLDERKGIHGLKFWAHRVGMGDYENEINQYHLEYPRSDPHRGGNMNLTPASILYPYNMDDCICTRREFFFQRKQLKKENLWNKPLRFPLLPINWVAAMIEIEGMNIDLKRNQELQDKFDDDLEKLDSRLLEYPEVKQLQKEQDEETLMAIYERVKNYKRPCPDIKKKVLELFKRKEINLNSPDTRRHLVFDILGCDSLEETPTGKSSAKRWVLEDLQKQTKSPLLKNLILKSELASAKSKYIDPVPNWAGTDGRTHTDYLPIGTATGRVSSKNPNHENLPKRNRLANELRTQFVGRNRKYWLIEMDSKQIELRIIADRAPDETMTKEFNEGKDPHAMGAQAAFNLTPKQWALLPKSKQKQLRSYSKNAISFGLVYGRSASALAADFGWSLKRAIRFKKRYFEKYFGIHAYLERRAKYIVKKKKVISKFGRPRRLPEAGDENEGRREAAIREGINTDIQGDASDISWTAAYRMLRWLRKNKMKSRVIIVVHDAVYLDAYYKEIDVVIPKLHEFMTDRVYIEAYTGWKLKVPLDTDVSVGPNLGEMEELEHMKTPGDFVIPLKFMEPQKLAA